MDAVARSPASPGVDGFDRAPIEQFLIHEALLLDGRRFRDWMGLFADDGTYWVWNSKSNSWVQGYANSDFGYVSGKRSYR